MRFAVLGLSEECNTFSVQPVDTAFIEAHVHRGAEIVARHRGGTTTTSGYLAACERLGVEAVPLVVAQLIPAGTITAEALRRYGDELVTALADHGPFDGVLTALHGAAVADDVADVDGYLLRRFREVVGPDVPIGVSLDLHANVSADMCAYSDVLNTYRTNPHVDAKEVAEEVAEIVIRAARKEIRPTQAFEALPAVINILCQNTDRSPMREVMGDVRAIMARPGVLSATVAEGFPYADVPEMGMGVVVVTDGDPAGAARYAGELAERVWARRSEFDASAPDAVAALRLAEQAPQAPILLLDMGDNIGGGASGDSVVLLNAARELGFASLLIIVADPDAAAECHRVGVGGAVTVSIGAKHYPETGPPVRATGTVLGLHHGTFDASEAVHAGMSHFEAGDSAALRLDTGQTVILTSRVALPLSPAQLDAFGLEPGEFTAIVGKGVHSPLAGYRPVVADVVWVDTPGVTAANLSWFTYRNRRVGLYPFEPDTRYPVVVGESR